MILTGDQEFYKGIGAILFEGKNRTILSPLSTITREQVYGKTDAGPF
jgi:hypothetical protein